MDATGAPPLLVAPGDVAGVRDALRDAIGVRTPLRIRGGGTWLDAGRPVHARATLDVSALRGIVEYVPGDLTLTARAGTTLAEIAEATAVHRQWLALDAPGAAAATLGATLATASCGPLAASIGLPRDVVLGLDFVAGDGRLVHGGGRVVKNVAGFDLVRLTTGAWGTTGVIVEATVRLRARPDADVTLLLPLPDETAALAAVLSRVRDAALEPLAAELVSDGLADAIGCAPADALLVRLGGNTSSVRAQRTELARIGPVHEVPTGTWEALRRAEPSSPCVFRLSARPTALAELWSVARPLVRSAGGAVHATLERGVVRCWLGGEPGEGLAQRLETALPADAGTRIFERLPPSWWERLTTSPGADRLASGIRRAFDPHHLLNRGIFGEAIDGA
jgi:glycolate oxidase FAD binding subunit